MEKIWIKNYPDGVENDVNLDNYESFVELFEDGFSKYSDKIAFENMGKSISYKELDDLSKKFSNFLLQELKLKQPHHSRRLKLNQQLSKLLMIYFQL